MERQELIQALPDRVARAVDQARNDLDDSHGRIGATHSKKAKQNTPLGGTCRKGYAAQHRSR